LECRPDLESLEQSPQTAEVLDELTVAANNITEPGEEEIVADIQKKYSIPTGSGNVLVQQRPLLLLIVHILFQTVSPPSLRKLDELLRLNQQAMPCASDDDDVIRRADFDGHLRSLCRGWLFCCLLFTAYIVQPVSLTDKAKHIAEGDFDQHIEIQSAMKSDPRR
jgi:hypothetical protein